jgi:hypothetical protein
MAHGPRQTGDFGLYEDRRFHSHFMRERSRVLPKEKSQKNVSLGESFKLGESEVIF